jgi:phage tail-like protein
MTQVKSSYLALGIVLAVSCSAWGAKDNRSYVSGNFFLTIDGVKCGFLKSVDGGAITAEVINEPAGKSYFVKKHIGQPKYEAFEVQAGFSMSKVFYNWIQQSWTMNYQRMGGSIVALDYSLQPKSERQFTQAIITETTIPAADASSKEPAYITLKFAPETTRITKPNSAASSKSEYGTYGKNEQKVWLPCNFKLEIDGIDCSKVNRIEPFTVKQTLATSSVGSARDTVKEPGKLEFPNLKITIPESAAQPFLDWHESFVIKGNNDEKAEKGGTLTFLMPSRPEPLAQIKFYNLGIFRVQPEKNEANSDSVKRVQVELYVERMEFVPGASVIASGARETPSSGTIPTPMTMSNRPG